MLILSRKLGESIVIDGRIRVKIVRVDGDVVKVGIEAPTEVPVHRLEVYEEIQRSNREAVTTARPTVPRLRSNSMPATVAPVPASATVCPVPTTPQ
ncbi:MAG: carbon storage regulator CsrA [Limisphaerales bacterium]